ncbi:MAG: UDP-glucose 4-epimerase GalE [Firmicutes bacterium]|nr:UDP-glucose 4-epimerase GalE [Bacillota bacterium]
MAVLLTGGAGYIGSHTAAELLAAGYQVVLADNFSNSSPKVPERIAMLTGKPAPVYRLDVTDGTALEKVFQDNTIDAVIHFAGLKSVAESVSQPLRYYRNNLDATLTLLEIMEKHNCHRLIFSSSATVYGDPRQVPVNEDMPVGGCANPYGRTKLMIEQILLDAAAAAPRLSVVLLRYFNPAGAHPSALLGEAPSGTPNNLMPFITQVALGQRPHLNVFGNDYPTPDGTGVRDYIHVVDLATGHLAALDYCAGAQGAEVFNLGTGLGYSVLDMVETFSRVNQVKVPYVIAPRRPGDIAVNYADPAKARKILGWQAEYTLEDMCRDAWRWQTLNPQGYDSPPPERPYLTWR